MKNIGYHEVFPTRIPNQTQPNSKIVEGVQEEGVRRQKLELVVRLNRIEGQIRGIKGMIEKDICCDDVLNQVSAVQAALYSAGRQLLFDHVRYCMAEKIKNDDKQAIEDLLISIDRLSSLNYK